MYHGACARQQGVRDHRFLAALVVVNHSSEEDSVRTVQSTFNELHSKLSFWPSVDGLADGAADHVVRCKLFNTIV